MNDKVSILLPSFKRPELLRRGLISILYNKPQCEFEIIVLNDGIEDETESVCNKFLEYGLPIHYFFTGKRNLDGVIKSRVPGFALNIGIKQAEGNIIVLSCPEIWHLNNTIDILLENLQQNPKGLVIPEFLYFDRSGEETLRLNIMSMFYPTLNLDKLVSGHYGYCHVEMPFLMMLYKEHLIAINGYDEDFIGYAGEDNDLIFRLQAIGLKHIRTAAKAVHLYHEGSTDGNCHWDNPAWVHNYTLLQNRKGIIQRNIGREWGVL
jgi:glycosyltransferase involved in cell wall biosynthesis